MLHLSRRFYIIFLCLLLVLTHCTLNTQDTDDLKSVKMNNIKPIGDKQLTYLKRFVAFARTTPQVFDTNNPNTVQPQIVDFTVGNNIASLFFLIYTNTNPPLLEMGYTDKDSKEKYTSDHFIQIAHKHPDEIKPAYKLAKKPSITIKIKEAKDWFYSESEDNKKILFAHQDASNKDAYDLVLFLSKKYLENPISHKGDARNIVFAESMHVIMSEVKKDSLDIDKLSVKDMEPLYFFPASRYYIQELIPTRFYLNGKSRGVEQIVSTESPTQLNTKGEERLYKYTNKDNTIYLSFKVKADARDPLNEIESLQFRSEVGRLPTNLDFTNEPNIKESIYHFKSVYIKVETQDDTIETIPVQVFLVKESISKQYRVLFASTRLSSNTLQARFYIPKKQDIKYLNYSDFVDEQGLVDPNLSFIEVHPVLR